MKYPRYVYKRINGQEYYCGIGDSIIQNLMYERKKEDTTERKVESSKKKSHFNYITNLERRRERMKITNKLNLPRAFEEMARSEYEYRDKQYSVTSLLRGVRETILKRRYHNEIESDVSDMIWMLFGRAVHSILEQQEEAGHELKEEYLKVNVGNGYKLSGMFDLYNGKTKTVTDYKTCSVWKVIYQDYEDWRKQLLMYSWMLQKIGFPVETGEIVAILKDHSKTKAKHDSNYPKYPVQVIRFSFLEKDFKEIEKFIKERFKEIEKAEQLPDDELPICTPEERYRSPDKWAVMKKGRKSALRVLESKEEAEQYLIENGGDYIEYRPGIDKKCIEYCDVNQFCSYYLQNVKEGKE